MPWDLFAKAAAGAAQGIGILPKSKAKKRKPAPRPAAPAPQPGQPVNIHVSQRGDADSGRHSPLAIAGAVAGFGAFILAAITLTRK